MKNLFTPKSIAIIGASNKPKKLGFQLTKNLIKQGYKGKIFPINYDEKLVLGLPAYHSVLDINATIDLAVIIIPREKVITVLKQCILKEIPYVLVITAGFAEKDPLGKKLQKEMIAITSNSKTKIIGPNCLGLINTENNLNLTFAASNIKIGNIGLILQSGAIGTAIFDWADKNEIGISKFISLGNKINITEIEALHELSNDPTTKIIALYLEQITYPEKLLFILKNITNHKPVIILKGGLTSQGAKAASTHTAALTSDARLDMALADQANLIFAENFAELLHFIEIFNTKVINLKSNSIAIITNAGGPGILASDSASRCNFTLARLSTIDKSRLAKKLFNYASLENPFDLGGDATAVVYDKVLQEIIKNDRFASIIVIVTPQSMTEIIKTAEVVSKYRSNQKPIVCAFMGGTKMAPAIKILQKNKIPNYEDPDLAIGLLAKIYKYHLKLNNNQFINFDKIVNQTFLSDEEIIKSYKLPFVQSYTVQNDAELMGILENMEYPLVYKTAKAITHKGKSGKVGLNIKDHNDLLKVVKMIGYPGFLQEMVDSPFEIIVGAKRHPLFGPMILFGQGGIFTEEFEDIQLKMYPLTEADIKEMIKSTHVYSQIKEMQVDKLLIDLIKKVMKIMLENSDIDEIEFNPVKVLPKKIIGVDINIKRK